MAVSPVVSFLSDYGTADEFVGVCKAVMVSIAPDVRVVDITHEIPPFDIRLGALTLVRAAQYLPEGIVLAIVDPGVATDQRHDSAHKHVAGSAIYTVAMPEPAGTLHAFMGLGSVAHVTIVKMDLSAVRAAPGVVDVLTARDVPGVNDISPTGRHDEPLLADGNADFHGQPFFSAIAETPEQARRSCRPANAAQK